MAALRPWSTVNIMSGRPFIVTTLFLGNNFGRKTYEMRQSVGGTKTGEPREKQNHLTHSQAELGLSHMARAGFEPTSDTAVRTLGTSPIIWGQSPDMTIAVD